MARDFDPNDGRICAADSDVTESEVEWSDGSYEGFDWRIDYENVAKTTKGQDTKENEPDNATPGVKTPQEKRKESVKKWRNTEKGKAWLRNKRKIAVKKSRKNSEKCKESRRQQSKRYRLKMKQLKNQAS